MAARITKNGACSGWADQPDVPSDHCRCITFFSFGLFKR
ncbi:AgrD family cyclic lactone autoinducer peptide [uncultured Tolumonas sp.]